MKINENDIRERVDRRLSGLNESEARRMRIRTAIDAERQANPPMKRKLSPMLAFALIAVLLTATIAVAEHLNLFSLFGEKDERYEHVAQQAALTTNEPVSISGNGLEAVTARMDSAYFDGLSLNMAFSIEQGVRYEAYTPDASELAGMEAAEPMPVMVEPNAPGGDVLQAYNDALLGGAPYGYRMCMVYPSDHTTTDDGIDIPPYTADVMHTADGVYAEMREFETPLPKELAERDALTLQVKLYQTVYTVYFDGEQVYTQSERMDAGVMTGVVQRTEGATRKLSGEAEINGVHCVAEGMVSQMAASVTVTCNAPLSSLLAAPPEGVDASDTWVNVLAYDEQGREYLATSGFRLYDERTEYEIAFLGVGELPEALTLYICSDWEGNVITKENVAGQAGVIIPLNVE